jgi:hypothetical protein
MRTWPRFAPILSFWKKPSGRRAPICADLGRVCKRRASGSRRSGCGDCRGMVAPAISDDTDAGEAKNEDRPGRCSGTFASRGLPTIWVLRARRRRELGRRSKPMLSSNPALLITEGITWLTHGAVHTRQKILPSNPARKSRWRHRPQLRSPAVRGG